ncbi:hypothetical protein KUL154_15990 [Alteromonas sp. KUL154]|nr:hypothetical protein KUL154_15990 [Alteromonas sp. KUL154]
MKTNKQKLEYKNLEKFSINKREALILEGGPRTDRGTVTTPVDDEE